MGVLCRAPSQLTEGNWEDALHLLRYLFGTRGEGFTMTGLGPIVVYADARGEENS